MESTFEAFKQFQDEINGLDVWMMEVADFMKAEEAAFGDISTLERQLQESDSLQNDIDTLRPNVTVMKESGAGLKVKADKVMLKYLEETLARVNSKWTLTVESSR